ncbi:MAG TPA: Rrf2 family transcriptional regulator [Polyangiaceae bacterium]|jgi:Rrf2 family nitric oxide-sensitive transcriptional repressor|nr:Rrf2 family transcriptional regulator [Polyangiaceae bacterium]
MRSPRRIRRSVKIPRTLVQLTSYTDYAFRTLIALACVAPEKLTVGEISDSYGISLNHLLKVVQKLAELGYVETTRGKTGGVRLLADPSTLKLGSIVRGMEPELGVVACLRSGEQPCVIAPACGLKAILRDATEQFLRTLDERTLADLTVGKPRIGRLLQLSARPD